MPTTSRSARDEDIAFVRKVFIVVAVAALVGAIWVLSDILLTLFGAVLFAIMLHAVAEPLQRHLGVPWRLALALAGLIILAIIVAAAVLLGPQLVTQMNNLFRVLPEASNRTADYLHLGSITDLMKEGTAASALGNLASRIVAWSSTVAGVLGSVLLIVFGGIYLAIDPDLYRRGLVKLVPPSLQPNARATLEDAGTALRRWLAGQLIAMVLVGIFTGAGLWLAGVPSPFALGLIAAIAEFVPIIGPIVAAVPAILLASTQSVETVLLAVAVFVVVQQVESNIIAPLVADKMVAIAPAVGLFAVVAMGVMFGPLGLLLGFPLAIVFDIAVRRLYVRDTLGERVDIMGKPAKPS